MFVFVIACSKSEQCETAGNLSGDLCNGTQLSLANTPSGCGKKTFMNWLVIPEVEQADKIKVNFVKIEVAESTNFSTTKINFYQREGFQKVILATWLQTLLTHLSP